MSVRDCICTVDGLSSMPAAAMNPAMVSTSVEISTKINLSLAQAAVGNVADVVFYVHLGQCVNDKWR